MNSLILLPLFVAAATAASVYSRSPTSIYLEDYLMDYPENYPIYPVFKFDDDLRQKPTQPVLTPQKVLAFAKWQTRNVVALLNLVNCLMNSSCSTVTVSSASRPTRIQTIIQQVLNNQNSGNRPTIIEALVQQISSILSSPVAQERIFRELSELPY